MAIIDIKTHIPQQNGIYFLDCNVLMYMHYTNGSYASTDISDYSKLVTQIIGANAKILMTDVLLSEFINTYIQAEFHRLAQLHRFPTSKRYFKTTFKRTQYYKDTLKELKCIISRQLRPVFEFVDCKFSSFDPDVSAIFDVPETFDFNDRYYNYEMNAHHAFIVTNDADFSKTSGCDIITNNASLLSV